MLKENRVTGEEGGLEVMVGARWCWQDKEEAVWGGGTCIDVGEEDQKCDSPQLLL